MIRYSVSPPYPMEYLVQDGKGDLYTIFVELSCCTYDIFLHHTQWSIRFRMLRGYEIGIQSVCITWVCCMIHSDANINQVSGYKCEHENLLSDRTTLTLTVKCYMCKYKSNYCE